jgi:crotonobetainyl-CoA:carnitine CoA-transferase CaiB-like acyl-CoA transferase
VTDSKSSAGPLAGIRVIEMTEALAGPYCAMMLGDLGADVIKVERDTGGDQARGWGPPFLGEESAYFLSVNRNKRSIALDIKKTGDLADLIQIVKSADVFITNNPRMESLQRYGLDPDSLRSANPGLVYAAISGYGHTGPKAGQPGYDLIAQGEAGLMALTGEPGSGPMRFPTPMADITAGLYTAIAIQSALYARDNSANGSGTGDFIDVSLVDAQMTWLANVGGTYFATGQRPPKLGNAHPTVAPYQPMRARDKAFIVAVGTERIWKKFCTALGMDELLTDARFATNASRNQHREELIPLLESVLGTRDAEEWVVELTACGVPAGPINTADEAVSSDQAKARGMVVELEHPSAGLVKSLGNPIHMAAGGPTYRRYPPRLGEHTAEIRSET